MACLAGIDAQCLGSVVSVFCAQCLANTAGGRKSILPHNYLGLIGAFMVAMGVIAQFVRQKTLLNEKRQSKEMES